MSTRKIGILGGTFNPIHYAHLLLGECAREQLGLDRVIFIPLGFHPGRTDNTMVAGDLRYQLVKLAISGNPYFTCSRVEIDRSGTAHTVETLQDLQKMYPGDELYFILGADSFLRIQQWQNYTEVFKLAHLAVAGRQDVDPAVLRDYAAALEKNYDAKVHLLDHFSMELSSTEIRKRFATGRSVRYMMPEECMEFICMKNLYAAPPESGSTNPDAASEEQEVIRTYTPGRHGSEKRIY